MTTTDPYPSGAAQTPGFEADIRPLFRALDRNSMLKGFDLWSYTDVRQHQDAIIEHLADGSMPCDGPWPPERVALLREWAAQGSRP